MKLKLFLILLLAAFIVAIHPRQARAQDDVSFDYFYDTLAPYGEWIEVGDYGYCWHPTNVDANWAPYTDGYWAYTDAGWTWVSYEEYGAIVYHYGRWTEVDGEGWCWTPDYEWAPAWVSWRSNNDYIGWAPLPPEARWQPDTGFSTWVDDSYDIGPDYYHFCRIGDFGAPVLRGVILNRSKNWSLMGRTRNITNMSYASYGGSRVVFNGGPNYAALKDVTHKPIPALKLVQNSHIDMAGIHGGRGGKLIATQKVGNQLIVSAPRVSAPADPNFLKGKASKVIPADKVTKGWSGVKDPAARQELKQQLQAQTNGLKPETAHARPVTPAELQGVPTQPSGNAPAGVVQGKRGKNGKAPSVAPSVAQPSSPGANTPQSAGVPAAPGANPSGVVEGKPRGKNGKPTPSAAVVTQPSQPAVTTPRGKNSDAQRQAQVQADGQAKARAMQKEKENGAAAQAQKEAAINQQKNAATQHQAQADAQAKAMQKDRGAAAAQAEKAAHASDAKRQEQQQKRQQQPPQPQPQQQQEAHSKQRPPEQAKPQPPQNRPAPAQPAAPKPAPAQNNNKKGGNPPNEKDKGKDKEKDKNGN